MERVNPVAEAESELILQQAYKSLLLLMNFQAATDFQNAFDFLSAEIVF